MSSYTNVDISYKEVLSLLTGLQEPKNIIEFGILNGYSLKIFADNAPTANITAYDIFDEFNGNSAKRDITTMFKEYLNVKIEYGDFYTKYVDIPDDTIDILHIDIANNGDIYTFAVENYMSKLKKGGLMILEGGSIERDNVEWMKKYNKPAITPVLKQLQIPYYTLGKMPSITVLKRI